jgi:hypothetical protein
MGLHDGLRGLVAAAAFATLSAASAQASDAQIWTAVAGSGSLSGPLELHADMNNRWYDSGASHAHFQLRGMLAWRFPSEALLGGGYSYVRTETAAGRVVHEHRLFQQLNLPIAKLGKARLTARTRLEQRRFEELDGVAFRLRQQIALAVPLKGPEGLRAIVYTEPFFLLNAPGGTSPPTGLNQVRSFAGLRIPVVERVALEAGYLNQYLLPGEDRANHALSLSLSTRF